ncbi:EpsG family protein [Sphingobacterium sp.]|uniref:EpsG family protein n=1 Tax=Sphingobacterium sp. TaxID=341027 RepID=UPI0031D2B0D6
MLGLSKNNLGNLRLDVKIHPLVSFIGIILFLTIGILLSTRNLDIAKDDHNYLSYFYYRKFEEADSFLIYLIEEPLWRLYTTSIVAVFKPENALRFTLFISTLMFLFSVNRVNVRMFIFVALIFILHSHFATQMYFNQIRQGLALSVFLFCTIYNRKPLLGAVIATLFHTSFIFPLIIIFLISKVNSVKWIIIYSIIGIGILYLSVNVLGQLDIGRRTNSYSFESKLSVNFYISIFLRYIPLLFLMKFYGDKGTSSFWYKLSLSSFIIIVPFTLFYLAAGRLMYYVSVFFLLMILEQSRSLGGKLGLLYYILFLIVDLFLFESTVISDWGLIISS